MPWLVIHRENKWCTYKEGADGKPTGDARGCFETEAEARNQQRALYKFAGTDMTDSLEFIGSLKLEADTEDPRVLRFKNAVLARAEVNGNRDEVDSEGITQLASTIAGMPISIEHDPRSKVGFFTAGNSENGTLFVDGAVWIEALQAQNIDVADIESGKRRLSVEAKAKVATCSNCGKTFDTVLGYCEHLLYRFKTGAVRKLSGLTATGGGLVRKPAGTDTHLGTLYLMASHQEASVGNDVEGIAKREDVSPADKARAEKEYEGGPFADTKNKKYSLRNEKEIRAAWSYVHMPKNRKFYSSSELKTVEGRIVAAWKRVIDKAGPPQAQEEKANMSDKSEEITEMTSAAFIEALNALTAKVGALSAAMPDGKDEDEMKKMRDEHEASAKRTADLESQLADLQAKFDAEKTAREEAVNRAVASRAEMLKHTLVGAIMDEEEFEKRKEELGALPDGAIELMLRGRQIEQRSPEKLRVAAGGNTKEAITLE